MEKKLYCISCCMTVLLMFLMHPLHVGVQASTSLIPVSDGTSVTVYERTTILLIRNFTVPVLTGAGGTFFTGAAEYYTVTSDGIYLKIHCFRDDWRSGFAVGNNIVAVRLNGAPGFPEGLWASIIVNYTIGYNGIAESRFNALGPESQIGPYEPVPGQGLCTYMGDQDSELVLGFTPPAFYLTIHSEPTGVPFTVYNASHTTPWSGIYSENTSVSLVMPETYDGYVWSRWLEDGDTNRTKVVFLDTNVTLTGVFTVIPSATIDIDPDTLNLKSRGRWITCYIELPEGYDVKDVNRITILLNGAIPVDSIWVDKPLESVIGDYDNDTIPDLMVKFSRAAVIDHILNQNITYETATLTVTGELYDGTLFEDNDMIRVKFPSDAKDEMLGEANSDNEKMLVMPELSSLLILPLFMIASLLVMIYRREH